ncbi:carbohydrate ABC transporter permease [Paenibacillus nasutitermitis]|uniref:Sugar ABC transporter permease n=1 Tax=Paenibacillus nasutitermitis TaxID=1652958 RepID=A0A916ZAF1_9BACL|nr:sugar ABC transporter permease [Paenibacillus nasutitermitis]GGD82322.1 sugar ABC transporter permease [Paenibacillus nasutitermitis]
MQIALKRLKRTWIGYVFVSPWLILFCVFGFFPILYSLVLSLQEARVMQEPVWVGLYNFKYLLSDPTSDLWLTLRNTVIFVVVYIPVLLLLSLGMAYMLNRKLKFEVFWKTAVFMPLVTAGVVYAIMWSNMLSANGILNTLLNALGFDDNTLLTNIHTAMPTVAAIDALKNAPYWTIIILTALTSISTDLYESATLDGATAYQKFRRITIPLISPTLYFMLYMASIGAWNVFDQVFVLTKGGPANGTLTLNYYLFSIFSRGRIGLASAVGIIIGCLVLLTVMVLKRFVKSENDYY